MKQFMQDIKMFWKTTKHIESLSRGLMILNIIRAIFIRLPPPYNSDSVPRKARRIYRPLLPTHHAYRIL